MNCCSISITFMCLLFWSSSCKPWKNGSSNVGNPKRPKRIVDGDIFYNRKEIPYKVVEFFVWIGSVHACSEGVSWWKTLFSAIFVVNCPESKEYLTCGGSLITPRIVQTACHCLANLPITGAKQRTLENLWRPAKVQHHFETRKRIYMGAVDVADFQYPILSKKFVVHQKCSKFSLPPGCNRYDFGWIILELEVPWQEGVLFGTWGKLDYAGPFHKQEMTTVYEQVIGQQHVCLLVGFGDTEVQGASQQLKHTWLQFLSWEQCFDVMYKVWDSANFYTYNTNATWICAQQLPNNPLNKFRGRSGSGDSGSPVTCSNNYVALVQGYLPFKKLRSGLNEMMLESAITFIPEANSVEMRKDWEYELLRRPPRTELRLLRIPSGRMLKHPGFKNPKLKEESVSAFVIS